MIKDEVLNVGSVVQLRGSSKEIMIVCRAILVGDNPDDAVYYDYGAIMFPEGMYDESLLYFYQEDIARVLSSPPDIEIEYELRKQIIKACKDNQFRRLKKGNNNKGW